MEAFLNSTAPKISILSENSLSMLLMNWSPSGLTLAWPRLASPRRLPAVRLDSRGGSLDAYFASLFSSKGQNDALTRASLGLGIVGEELLTDLLDGGEVVHYVLPDIRDLPGLFLAHPVPGIHKGPDQHGELLAGLLRKVIQDPLARLLAVLNGLLRITRNRFPSVWREGVRNVDVKGAKTIEGGKSGRCGKRQKMMTQTW